VVREIIEKAEVEKKKEKIKRKIIIIGKNGAAGRG
jgi:hypothetical protein